MNVQNSNFAQMSDIQQSKSNPFSAAVSIIVLGLVFFFLLAAGLLFAAYRFLSSYEEPVQESVSNVTDVVEQEVVTEEIEYLSPDEDEEMESVETADGDVLPVEIE